MTWAEKELKSAELGHKGRDKRFCLIVDFFLSNPTGSIPEVAAKWYDVKAMYQFFKNDSITDQDLLMPHFDSVKSRAQEHEVVIIAHDTTECIFASDASGLGYLDKNGTPGILSHNSLVLSSDGMPLGLIAQKNWNRPWEEFGKRNTRFRLIEDKESYKWIEGIRISDARLSKIQKRIHVCDRESDIYELINEPRAEGAHFIIRAAQNRKTSEGVLLWDQLTRQPIADQYNITVLKNKGKEHRKAKVEIRYTTVELLPPDPNNRKKPLVPLEPQKVAAIYVVEKDAPSAKDKIEWMLLSSLQVETLEQALQCVKFYSYRWRIERYFYVLKQGTILEKLQLRDALRLQLALATLSIVAFRIMWLAYYSRTSPDLPCEREFTPSEWKALYCIHYKTDKIPEKPPSLRETTRMIAMLGGFLGRKSDGEPGLKTLWKGMLRLADIAMTYEILKSSTLPGNESFG